MADRTRIVPGNVPGNFFVDTTCINCDNCRILAPEIFGEFGDYAGVKRQPVTAVEMRRALQALICCPTGSIGTTDKGNIKEVMADFPMLIGDGVYYTGFNSPKSYGGKSYFVESASGNWLVDAPKFHPQLTSKFEEAGGLKYIFLTHRDDCADAARYAEKFGSKRIIHEYDIEAQPDAEIVIRGGEPVEIEPGFLVIPMPGHTEGHCMLLYASEYLFSGDVFTSDRYGISGLIPYSPLWCWYSWQELTRSLDRLKSYRFQWVLPGHGRWIKAPADVMQEQLAAAIDWAERQEPEPETAERLKNLQMYLDAMRQSNQPVKAAQTEEKVARLKAKLGL